MGLQILKSPARDVRPLVGRSISLQHAARMLRVSRRTIYYRIRDGQLQTIRTLGGSQRVLLDSIEDLVTCSRKDLYV